MIAIPLRYAHDSSSNEFIDFNSGLKSGVHVMPLVMQGQNGQVSIDKNGAILYLSERTADSQLARLYLYKDNDPYFTLVHSEDDYVVSILKSQNAITSDFVFFNGLRGPIRIWEINYPQSVVDKGVNQEYIRTDYPDEGLAIAK